MTAELALTALAGPVHEVVDVRSDLDQAVLRTVIAERASRSQ